MARRWPWLAGTFAYLLTVVSAATVIARMRHRSGHDLAFAQALLWQGTLYACWIPFAWVVARLIRRLGFNGRLFALLYAVSLLAAVAHSLVALWLQAQFGDGALRWTALETGLPIDLLIATAIAAFVAAVEAQRMAADAAAQLAALEAVLASARQASAARLAERLLVSVGSKRKSLPTDEIEWLAAAGNYVVVNWAGGEGLVRETLSGLASRLDPQVFVRSHRSTVLNLGKVAHATPLADGSWRATLQSGADLVVSRTYRDEVLSRLKGSGPTQA